MSWDKKNNNNKNNNKNYTINHIYGIIEFIGKNNKKI